MDEADDHVGYGRPPKRTRFKPGVSGNLSGRPKRRPTIDDFIRKLLDGPATILKEGHKITVSGREAVAFTFFAGALKGERDSLKKVDAVDQEGDGEQFEEEIIPAEEAEIIETFSEQVAGASSGDAEPEPPALPAPSNTDDGSE
jgi:hypothetical protein